jgi:HAMP domain-containing protein
VTALAGGDLALPAEIQWSDIYYISLRVLIIALILTAIGILVLRQVAARSIGLMITIVVAVSVLCSMAGVGVIAYRMLGSAEERDEILDLMVIAGLAALVVALFVARRLIRASRAISASVQEVGETGVYIAPPPPLPAELAELSEGLTVAHERLSSSPGSATTCAPRWPGCAPWPRRSRTRWWSTRARCPSTTPRSAARSTG